MAKPWKTCILNQELSLDTTVSLNLSQVLNEDRLLVARSSQANVTPCPMYVIVFLFSSIMSSHLSVCYLKSHIASEFSIIFFICWVSMIFSLHSHTLQRE